MITGNQKEATPNRFIFVLGWHKNILYNPMLKKSTTQKICSISFSCLLVLAILFIASCKKTDNVKEEAALQLPVFSYEINCDYCDITYTNKDNQNLTIKNNKGSWIYKIDTKVTFELKLAIKTTLLSAQTIQAYILKDNDVVHGNLGYNFANITYNTQQDSGTANFGTYASSGSSGGNGTGGSTSPISSVCGAKNKSGGYCKRVVVGGGRCWQHR